MLNVSLANICIDDYRGKDGVVFAVEKIVTSKLYEKGANR